MVWFDVQSRTIEIRGNDEGRPFNVHEDLLRRHHGTYGLMIDQAVQTTGKASIKIDLGSDVLEFWTKWLYGESLEDWNDVDGLEGLAQLYEYCHNPLHSKVDHACANACLDGIRTILAFGLDDNGVYPTFGDYRPPLAEIVTRLDKPDGKGVQMLVDLLVYSDSLNESGIVDLIKEMEPEPRLAPLFHKVSYALAIKLFNATRDEGLEEALQTPDITSAHAYHSRKEGTSIDMCCMTG